MKFKYWSNEYFSNSPLKKFSLCFIQVKLIDEFLEQFQINLFVSGKKGEED